MTYIREPTIVACPLATVSLKINKQDFPGGAVAKNMPANAGDMSSIPGPGRSHMPQSN